MKKYKIIALLVFLAIFSFSAVVKTKFNLEDAVRNNSVSVSMLGNGASTHYYEPVLAIINNNMSSAIDVNLSAGMLLDPADKSEQTLMVMEDLLVNLTPKQSKTIKIKAMCTEPWDRAGSSSSVYSLRKNNNDTLIKLANFIAANKYFTAGGQSALWTLVRKNSLAEVYGADTIEQNKLRTFLNQITGLPMPKPGELNDYRYNYYIPPKETLSGYFQFGMQHPHDVQVAMFDTTGILVRELFNQKQFMPFNGQKINYQFDFTVYQNDKYFVKLIVDNEVIMTRPINAKAFRDKYKQQMEQR